MLIVKSHPPQADDFFFNNNKIRPFNRNINDAIFSLGIGCKIPRLHTALTIIKNLRGRLQ